MFHVSHSYLLFSFDFRVSHTDYPICFTRLRIMISNTFVYRHIHMHNSSCICVCLLTRIFAHLTYKRNARELKKTAWNELYCIDRLYRAKGVTCMHVLNVTFLRVVQMFKHLSYLYEICVKLSSFL